MATGMDYGDARYAALAEAILRRHEGGEAEANSTSAVRDFLIATGLAAASEIVEEVHPGDAGRLAVALTALDTYVECKRRTGYPQPEQQWVEQLDGYLAASQAAGRGVRLGVLTDGGHWFLRWPGRDRRGASGRTRSCSATRPSGSPSMSGFAITLSGRANISGPPRNRVPALRQGQRPL